MTPIPAFIPIVDADGKQTQTLLEYLAALQAKIDEYEARLVALEP